MKPTQVNYQISQIFKNNMTNNTHKHNNQSSITYYDKNNDNAGKNDIVAFQRQLYPPRQRNAVKSFEILEFPSFKKASTNSFTIQNNEVVKDFRDNSLNSPSIRNFFEKKQNEVMSQHKAKSNFKDIIKNDELIINMNSSSSHSRQQRNQNINKNSLSRSNNSQASSSFRHRSHNLTQQFKKIQQQNYRVRVQFQKKLKLESELNEFQKRLLKQQKTRYITKIQQLQQQLQKLYRQNYKLKQQQQLVSASSELNRKLGNMSSNNQKNDKDKQFQTNSESFNDIHENVNRIKDYYQPYVMMTQQNDLKRLMKGDRYEDICRGKMKPEINININNIERIYHHNNNTSKHNKNDKNLAIDMLGMELQKQMKQLEQQRKRTIKSNNNSIHDSHKNNHNNNKQLFKKFQNPQQQHNESFESQILLDLQMLKQSKQLKPNNSHQYQNPYQPSKHKQTNQLSVYPSKHLNTLAPVTQSKQQKLHYMPIPDYSFTKNKDQYSISSSSNNYESFDMTRTFLQPKSIVEESLTNKYIDSKTSTRNKVAFFKDSLILIKTSKFQVAFKRSSLIHPTKDRCRVIFFIQNKTHQPITVKFSYQYDAGYFKLKQNTKLRIIPALSQGKQDIQIYHYSTNDLNEVIDVMVEVGQQKYGLWMPTIWIQFSKEDEEQFNMASNVEEICVIPDRQFKNYLTAKEILPLMYGGKDGYYEWAYITGTCKFGKCHIKLTWEDSKELRIQSNSKWIDLLAFVMHHVK